MRSFRPSLGIRILTYVIAAWLAYKFWILGVGLRDNYVGYSGVIVAKGTNWLSSARWDNFWVIRDSTRHEQRRYVHQTIHYLPIGTFVVKRRGWFAPIEHPGYLGAREMLDSAKRTLARHGRDTTSHSNNPLENPDAPSGILLAGLVFLMGLVLLEGRRMLRRGRRVTRLPMIEYDSGEDQNRQTP